MMSEPSSSAPSPASAASETEPHTLVSRGYARYALGVLLAVYVVNFVDRQILSILLPSIQQDLGLNDTQLGILGGVAFAIFYATLGIPIGRLADRWSRKGVIAIAIALWSAMTALCGMAGGFWQLLAARVGVGVGEAGGSPPAHSLIAEYFPERQRGTALSIFSLGVPIGILFGFLAGGWINEFFGWRRAFFVVGVPGLIMAAVVALTLRETAPAGRAAGTSGAPAAPPVGDVFRYLWSLPSFRHASFAAALYAFVGYAVIGWVPTFLVRSHGMSSGPIGTWLALIVGIGGGLGTVLGGRLADGYGLRDRRAYVYVPAIAMLLCAPPGIVIYLSDQTALAIAALTIPMLCGSMYQGPTFSVVQSLAPPSMRSTAAAVLLFVINIVGMGLGPSAAGMLSDLFKPTWGDDSLRYALLCVTLLYLWAAFHFWRAGRTLREDLARVPE